MNNLIILPIIIPFISGMIMVVFRKNITFQKWLGSLALLSTGIVSVILVTLVRSQGIQSIQIGGWQAPFGITVVADMFAALLLVASFLVAIACFVYSFYTIGDDRERHYYYPFFLFLITGVNGSFLTGDMFNLFVFFEVMLISSYVLITLGSSKGQLRESVKYVIVNVISSFLFLVALAYIYGVTGTLNMAHLSVRVAESGQDGLLTTIAILFLIVFSLKAALLLFFWLPGSYSAPPAAIAAIFSALLTKVGIYAIFRVFTLIFYHEPQITHMLIGIMGALTMILGGIGAIAYWDIKKILAYNVIVSVGFIVAGLAAFTYNGLLGSIYYLVHDIIIKALIFLIAGVMIAITGTAKLREISGLIRNHPYLGWMFFIAALSIAGIPPLSGFVGKLFITRGTFEAGLFWLGAIGFLTSLMVLYSVMKIFMNAFWGETNLSIEKERATTKGVALPIAFLTALTIALGFGAEGLHDYVKIAVEGLLDPSIYVNAVFKGNPIP